MHQYIIIIFIYLCLPLLSQSQSVQDDFEGNGTITSWFGDNCSINTQLANPYQEGINTSATILEYGDTGGQYTNVRFDISNNFDLSSDFLFSLKIYVPSTGLTGGQPNQISLKLQDGTLGQSWITQSEVIKPIVLNQWQTVSFDFKNDPYINLDNSSLPPTQRTDFNRVVIQVNGENNTDHVLAWMDDFYYDGAITADPIFDRLIWSDEFEQDGAIDNTRWFHQTQLPTPGSWYNGEIQHYTNRTDNSIAVDGVLKITAKKETFSDQGYTKQYTSARLNSKFAFTYGRVEVRAKLPSGVGTWPAIWTLGKNINENGAYWDLQGFGTTSWPACGEIDIMEHWGNNQNYIQSAIHTPSSFGGTVNLGGQQVATASTDFHIYTLVWTPEKLQFSVDSAIYYTYNPSIKDASTWPFDAAQYLLLNIAIQQSIHPDFTQSAMEIDYVRIYQESPVSAEHLDIPQDLLYYPNPVVNDLTITLQKTDPQYIAVNIYSMDGNLIKRYDTPVHNNLLTLNHLGYLPGGMYIISFIANDRPYSIKITKQ